MSAQVFDPGSASHARVANSDSGNEFRSNLKIGHSDDE